MDKAYEDKLDGKIEPEFWQRKQVEWQREEQQMHFAIRKLETTKIEDRAMNAERVFELENRAYFLYISQTLQEKANCSG